MKRIKKWIAIFAIAVIGIGAMGQVYISKAGYEEAEKQDELQSSLAHKIIRFHVIADNDTDEAQQLKLTVKNETLQYMQTLLTGTEDLETTRTVLENNLDQIEKFAAEVVKREGYEYTVSAEFENCYFPIKEYGSLIFPAGYYDALRIKLGKAEGRNWWCVMYPNLCFVQGTYAVVNDEVKETLEGMLTPEEYKMLLSGSNTKVSFKYLKFLNN
ncbi:stage II sporulation protein R [Konateibacter massiliensis]|uniref:stage II sporulation protein R n=1 Tax=Konateibacter massiliensis TaxID=2002841 RepID=UPI000C157BF9|nr:stage II sporulation protein R [Konateibacter massiliensis]